jgi:hypothetical protein
MKATTILRYVGVALLFLGLVFWAKSQPSQAGKPSVAASQLIEQADAAYRANRMDKALPKYKELLNTYRRTSPRILQRLASGEEAQGSIPQTLYYLNLLYTLQPQESVRTHMESLAQQYQLEGYDMDEWDFFRKLLRRFSVHLFAGFALGIAALVGLLWWRRLRGKKLRLLPLAVLLLLVLASAALNLDFRYGKAIVITGKAAFMSEASAASHMLGQVPPGTRLTVLGTTDIWMRVVYKDKQGFVNKTVVWWF